MWGAGALKPQLPLAPRAAPAAEAARRAAAWGGHTFLAEEGQISFMYFFEYFFENERQISQKFLGPVS